jgi:hypothetical protein
MRRFATWLLALPVPDPDLQCELITWAAMFLWLANRLEYRGDRVVAVLGVLAAPRRARWGYAGGGAVSQETRVARTDPGCTLLLRGVRAYQGSIRTHVKPWGSVGGRPAGCVARFLVCSAASSRWCRGTRLRRHQCTTSPSQRFIACTHRNHVAMSGPPLAPAKERSWQ